MPFKGADHGIAMRRSPTPDIASRVVGGASWHWPRSSARSCATTAQLLQMSPFAAGLLLVLLWLPAAARCGEAGSPAATATLLPKLEPTIVVVDASRDTAAHSWEAKEALLATVVLQGFPREESTRSLIQRTAPAGSKFVVEGYQGANGDTRPVPIGDGRCGGWAPEHANNASAALEAAKPHGRNDDFLSPRALTATWAKANASSSHSADGGGSGGVSGARLRRKVAAALKTTDDEVEVAEAYGCNGDPLENATQVCTCLGSAAGEGGDGSGSSDSSSSRDAAPRCPGCE